MDGMSLELRARVGRAHALAFHLARYMQIAMQHGSKDRRVRWMWLLQQGQETLSLALRNDAKLPGYPSYPYLLKAGLGEESVADLFQAILRHVSEERYPAENSADVAQALARIAEAEGMALLTATRGWGGDGAFENLRILCSEVRGDAAGVQQRDGALAPRAWLGLAQQLSFQLFRFSTTVARTAEPDNPEDIWGVKIEWRKMLRFGQALLKSILDERPDARLDVRPYFPDAPLCWNLVEADPPESTVTRTKGGHVEAWSGKRSLREVTQHVLMMLHQLLCDHRSWFDPGDVHLAVPRLDPEGVARRLAEFAVEMGVEEMTSEVPFICAAIDSEVADIDSIENLRLVAALALAMPGEAAG